MNILNSNSGQSVHAWECVTDLMEVGGGRRRAEGEVEEEEVTFF